MIQITDIPSDYPIGVLLVEIRSLGYCLGLQPCSEEQSEPVYLVSKLRDARRELHRVCVPVAEARVAVIPRAEPSIVYDDSLKPHRLRVLRHLEDLVLIVAEICAFPCIEHQGLHPALPETSDYVVLYECMHPVRCAIDAFIAVCHHSLGRLEGAIGLDRP